MIFSPRAWKQYLYWHEQDRRIAKKINALVVECTRTPFSGTASPEPLKNQLSGWWSRRIDKEHRLVYRLEGDDLIIAQCRYHYDE